MSKNHLKSLAEQIAANGYASFPFHHKIRVYQPRMINPNNSIHAGQYQIPYPQREGSLVHGLDLNHDIKKAVSVLINEGGPNTQC